MMWVLAQRSLCVVGVIGMVGGICEIGFKIDSFNKVIKWILIAVFDSVGLCLLFFVELTYMLKTTRLLIDYYSFCIIQNLMMAHNILKPDTFTKERLIIIDHMVKKSMEELEATGSLMTTDEIANTLWQVMAVCGIYEMLLREYHQ
jgi:hypothetical protein